MSDSASLSEVDFRNPDVQLGLEVIPFAELLSRLSGGSLASGLHRTRFHQLFVFVGGGGTMTIDFVEHSCLPGGAVHVRPGQVLALPTPEANGLDAVAVLFTPAFVQPNPQLERILGFYGPATWQTEEDGRRRALLASTRELQLGYEEVLGPDRPPEIAVAMLRQLLGVLLLRLSLLSTAEEPDHGGVHELVARFRAELERSFSSTRNAGEYAQRLGYSTRTLNRACAAALGHTAKELIDERVGLEAKRLLAHTSLPAASISQRLGFAEATNFHKFFVRQAGETPGEFRAAHQAVPSPQRISG